MKNYNLDNTISLRNEIQYLKRKIKSLNEVLNIQEEEIKELRQDKKLVSDFYENECSNRVWVWQSDGYDNSSTMANDLPILIRAYQLRALIKHGEKVAEELQE
jgi:hypothetical protein